VPGEYLVKFRAPTDAAFASHTVRAASFSSRRAFHSVPGLYHITANVGVSPREAAARLAREPAVEYVEPNFTVKATAVPNDPMFSQQWALNNTIQFGTGNPDIGAEAAWNITTGSANVVVAIIDSGVDYNHPDLSGNVWVNAAGCSGTDTDGYPNDCHGINAITGSGDPLDDFFHGTHVAGIIGATGNNAIGMTGVNWTTTMLACKFLDSTGSGDTADAITCLDYIALQKNRGVNIVATNNSWGASTYSQALSDAIGAQLRLGILFIAAAGNNSLDNDQNPSYPCSFDHSNIICVASAVDSLSDFSDYGAGTVHLAAPGESILSTVLNGKYANEDGTSMAAAYVTGVVGLLAAQDPTRDWRAIKNLVLAGAVPPSQGVIPTVTGGRLRAINSMACTNSIVEARLRPAIFETITLAVGASLPLEAININCATPNGNVVVSVQPGGEAVTLVDDGTGNDEVAGDGVYSGAWTATAAGTYTLTFPGGSANTVNVVVDAMLKPGFPTQMYFQPDDGGQTPFPAVSLIVGAIDSNPGLEIISPGYTAGPLYAWKADGTAEPGWPNYDVSETVQVSLGTFASGAPSGIAAAGYYSGKLYLYNGDATAISGWPQPVSNNYFPAPTIDLTGGGIDAIISVPAYHADGTLLGPASTIPAAAPAGEPSIGPVAVADLNAVGQSNFVEANYELVWASSVQGMLPGFPVANPIGGAGLPVTPVVGDVDGDGKPNIIVPTYTTTGSGGTGPAYLAINIYDNQGVLLRTLTTATGPFINVTVAALGDLDGDGIPEIIIATGGQLYAWKGDGTPMPGFPVSLPSGQVAISPVAVGDIDGDGYPDIVFASGVSNTSTGFLHAFDRHGVELAGFPKSFFAIGTGASVAIADLDGSHHNDLIVASTPPPGFRDSIFVYDLKGAGPYGPIEWGQYMEGASHRGFYQTGKNLTTKAYLTAQAHGAGVITSGDGAINCGSSCIHLYPDGSTVSLTAAAGSGASFTQWLGACAGQANPCTVTVNSYTAVSADFLSPVTVTVVGNGSVTSSPAGINCPTVCTASFPARTSVVLTATPTSGSVLAGWNGSCTGAAATCSLAVNSAEAASAHFTDHFTLSVAYSGAGTLMLSSSPAGISCGSVCQASFAPGTVVTLSAAYSQTAYITDWGVPGCNASSPTCQVTLNADTALTVMLAPNPSISVSVTGSGSIQVSDSSNSAAPSDTCSTDCTYYFQPGTLQLAATPATNSHFVSWGGACNGTAGGSCVVNLANSISASAQFALNPQLTVTFSGSGQGSVSESQGTITANCTASCTESISPGSTVTLTVSPNPNSAFGGWSGACSGTAQSCTVTMTANESVGVTFNSTTSAGGGHSGGGAVDWSACIGLLALTLARARRLSALRKWPRFSSSLR
jgi:subtilisin family serine protease